MTDNDSGVAEIVLGAGDQLVNAGCQHRIQTGCRLVKQNDFRIHDQRPRQAGAFSHSAAQFRGNLCPISPKPTCSSRSATLFLIHFPSFLFSHAMEMRRCRKQSSSRAVRRLEKARRIWLGFGTSSFWPSLVMSTPLMKTSPRSGSSNAFKCFSSTVLPQPLVPTMVVILPVVNSRFTPLRTCLPAESSCIN